VGILVNQTSIIGSKPIVDSLVALGVNIVTIFGPEHGFRGTASNGDKVNDSVDPKTGIPAISLYGKQKKPTKEQMAAIDLMIFDIQDVGARFYTYINTLGHVMEACAETNKEMLILDRPNPNGFMVDGPVPGRSPALGHRHVQDTDYARADDRGICPDDQWRGMAAQQNAVSAQNH
jgi:uncharacterized protein YbbC (DUF1343 family)